MPVQYCVELVSLLTTEEDPNPALYDLLVRTLERLSSGAGHLAAHTIRFEIGILSAAGYGIDWQRCIGCGGDLGGDTGGSLSAAFGGVVCSRCAERTREKAALAPGALAAARLLATGARRAERLRLTDNQTKPLGLALGRYITYVAGRPPKMLKYVSAISEGKRPVASTADGS